MRVLFNGFECDMDICGGGGQKLSTVKGTAKSTAGGNLANGFASPDGPPSEPRYRGRTRDQIYEDLARQVAHVSHRWFSNEADAVRAIAATGIGTLARYYNIEVGFALFRRPDAVADVTAPTYVGAVATQFLSHTIGVAEGSMPPSGDWDYAGSVHNHPGGGRFGGQMNAFSVYDFSSARYAVPGNAYLLAPDGRIYVYDIQARRAAGFKGPPEDYVKVFEPSR